MKNLLILFLLIPVLVNAQPKNRYADTTLTAVDILFHTADGKTFTPANMKRVYFRDDTTVIVQGYDSSRVWFPQVKKPEALITQFGLMAANQTLDQTEQILTKAGIEIVRVPLFFSSTISSNQIDNYLDDGYKVQINLNWKATNAGPVPFPTDTALIRTRAEAFFKYYQPWVNRIPMVVVENEWDNGILTAVGTGYHSGTIQDYLTELSIVVEVGHKYGFKVCDAGITDGAIKQWYSGKLDLTEFFTGIKTIPTDTVNFHWYVSADAVKAYDVKIVALAYMQACGKTHIVNNEFGIRTDTPDLWLALIGALKGFADCAIAYSGVNDPGKAIQLTPDMINELNQ